MTLEERLPHDSRLLIVDLEATCETGNDWSLTDMEIIEIGAVVVQSGSWQSVSEFQCFVRPDRHPVLTEFCRRLTGINQEDVAQAAAFPEAFRDFVTWLNAYQPVAWASWGEYDRKHIVQECESHRLEYRMPAQHMNLKELFQERQGLIRAVGMKKALESKGLVQSGSHHRALDDVRNIVQLLPFVFSATLR